MKKYEGLFILKPNLSEEEFGRVSAAIADAVEKNGGKVENKEEMGLRDLAYEIRKEKKGRYLLIYFMAEAEAIRILTKAYKLNESILRSIVFEREGK